MTAITLMAVSRTLKSHLKSNGREGSLVLPCIIVLGTAFPGLFALAYPYDGTAVLNPRYLLPISIPMAACLGMALGQFKAASWRRKLAHAVVLASIACVATLVVYERFGT
jgi:hypothetical protein